METVSVINYKGGVGKTTVVANVAAELGWRGKRVLLIDLDPQASLTFSFFDVDTWAEIFADSVTIRNWYYAFLEHDHNLELATLVVRPTRLNDIVRNSNSDGRVDMICSHLGLINIDLELATMLRGADISQIRNNFLRLHSRLLLGLESIRDSYDIVMIDCPPNFNIVTKTAIVASDHILVPAIQDYLSTLGIDELQRHIDDLVVSYNSFAELQGGPPYQSISPTIVGVIPTMVQVYGGKPIAVQSNYIDELRRKGLPVFETYIRRNNSTYGDAPQYGVPVVLQNVGTRGYTRVRDDLVAELEDLTTEFAEKIEMEVYHD
ncbi:MAG: ParA family protein [Caldilineaceae bacterium]|nr:ParA family protein [Caldilineaceae bacterium]